MPSSRLHSLDALRTVAALAVVLAHWPQHFFSLKQFAEPYDAAPFFGQLSVFYRYGPLAVVFFFCLSGFIFYWLYADDVHSMKIGIRHFALLRISRLYPLHFTTLLLMVPLVLIVRNLAHVDFVCQYNDLYHFALNLLFAQYWGFESGYSWNGPSWSISVEVALYIAFFIACRIFRPCAGQAALLIVVAIAASSYSIITSSGVAFFAGGLAYYCFSFARRHCATAAAFTIVGCTVVAWGIVWFLTEKGIIGPIIDAAHKAASDGSFRGELLRPAQLVWSFKYSLVLFPSVIFACAFLEAATPFLRWRALGGLGNISFGIYLLHFPLQCIAVSLALGLSMPQDLFTQPATFAVFFLMLFPAAVASYAWLERPAMMAMRGRIVPVEEKVSQVS